MKPFRWNLAKEEQLGRLTEGERSESYPEFLGQLRACCSRLLSFSEDGRIAFVGRSPESLYDYLSGILAGTSKSDDLVLVNISNRFQSVLEIRAGRPSAYRALREHFAECGLSPRAIISHKAKTYFADMVASGSTFGQIATLLCTWAEEEKLNLKDLRSKLGFLGITSRGKTSPNTWRWQHEVPWVKELQIKNIKNVSAPWEFCAFIGNYQAKVSQTNPPESWDSESLLDPPREKVNLRALRRAFDLYRRGQQEKERFSDLLGKEKAMGEAWFRRVISELR